MKTLINYVEIYGVLGFLSLLKDLILAKILYRKWNPRIIRAHAKIRGMKYMSIGKDFSAGYRLRMDAFGVDKIQIEIGDNVNVGDDVHIAAVKKVIIGADSLLASKIYISDHNHGKYNGFMQSKPFEKVYKRKLNSEEVIIGRNVWIGEFVSILPGVKIGDNSIIAANSVVTKDIPENTIAAGIPAKPIKKWSEEVGEWKNIR